jgi:hypothetical protein
MAAARQLVCPDNHTLILLDHESQMVLAVALHPIEMVIERKHRTFQGSKLV